MIVCWLTLQILAASPVVKTVFMVGFAPFTRAPWAILRLDRTRRTSDPDRLDHLAGRPRFLPETGPARNVDGDHRPRPLGRPNESRSPSKCNPDRSCQVRQNLAILPNLTNIANYKIGASGPVNPEKTAAIGRSSVACHDPGGRGTMGRDAPSSGPGIGSDDLRRGVSGAAAGATRRDRAASGRPAGWRCRPG